MWNRQSYWAARGLAWGLLVLSMGYSASVRSADAKADAAEAAAAMERAKKQAANPLRVILEASKVRRKVNGDAEPAVAAVPASVAAVTVPANGPTLTAAAAPAAAAGVTTVKTLTAAVGVAAVESRLSAPVDLAPVLEPADKLPPVSAMPTVPAPTPALSEAVVKPRLLDMVEPAVPQRVLDEIGRQVEIQADVTIRADGSVAAVSVLPPAPRPMVRYVVAAIERWRFEPLPAERVHRVQLLFNER